MNFNDDDSTVREAQLAEMRRALVPAVTVPELEAARAETTRLKTALAAAVEPVRHWFDGGGEIKSPTDVAIAAMAVEELVRDRDELIRARNLLAKVAKMRTAQRGWLSGRDRGVLDESQRLEAEVDKALAAARPGESSLFGDLL